jgi:preprotein translocase subunit SecB
MKENVIQHQISLVAFKAVDVKFSVSSSLTDSQTDPIFDLKLSDLLINDNPNVFAKVFQLNLVINNISLKEIINFNVEFHTVFQCSENINEEFLNSEFSKISAPAIGFPYLRAFVSNLSIQAGLSPIILPSINFVQFHNNETKN